MGEGVVQRFLSVVQNRPILSPPPYSHRAAGASTAAYPCTPCIALVIRLKSEAKRGAGLASPKLFVPLICCSIIGQFGFYSCFRTWAKRIQNTFNSLAFLFLCLSLYHPIEMPIIGSARAKTCTNGKVQHRQTRPLITGQMDKFTEIANEIGKKTLQN